MTENKELNLLVRVNSTDLNGRKNIVYALTKIKGVSLMFANATCKLAKIDTSKKTGYLTEAEVKALEGALKDVSKFPTWMLNRRKDYETGEDVHLFQADLTFTQDNDLKRLKMIKSNRGFRHTWGLTTRGQRTQSNFRKTKTANSKKKKKRPVRKS